MNQYRRKSKRNVTRLNSLLLVEEKILEAEYFAGRLRWLCADDFRYEFNAFLSAARSVTFLLQKEMKTVLGFDQWWDDRIKEMNEDSAMKFFRDLRNFSQKEGRISMVGTMSRDGSGRSFWSYRFGGNKSPVPKQLLQRDVAECCCEHLSKLAIIVLACADVFPYHSCPRRAVTLEGLKTLGLQLSDIEEILGLPSGCTDVAGIPQEEIFRILQGHFDGVDFEGIRRIAEYTPEQDATVSTPSDRLNDELTQALVNEIERLSSAQTEKIKFKGN